MKKLKAIVVALALLTIPVSAVDASGCKKCEEVAGIMSCVYASPGPGAWRGCATVDEFCTLWVYCDWWG